MGTEVHRPQADEDRKVSIEDKFKVRCGHRILRFTDLRNILQSAFFIPTVSSRHLPLQQGEAEYCDIFDLCEIIII